MRKILGTVGRALGLADVFVFGGLGLFAYGLWCLRPWLGYAACGLVLMLLGLLVPRGRRREG